jgi:hypothetical protein
MTSWTITKDLLGNGEENGVTGPRNAALNADEIKAHPDAVEFRMKDDDGEVYYYGKLVGDDLFAPLDDFGMPNAGCTSVEVKEDGQWTTV